MNRLIHAPRRIARRLVAPLRRPRAAAWLEALPGFALPAGAIETLPGPAAFHRALLAQIAQATRRIVIVALYLQDDDAGREVLAALHAARARHPRLEVDVYVDWHRARRGLIGKQGSPGNAAMYREYAQRLGDGVRVWGVPVQNRELFGVLHLKGFVFDDVVLYSGASLNDVYLAKHGRYRLDRYHLLRERALADAMAGFVRQHFHGDPAVCRLDAGEPPPTRSLLPAIRAFRQRLQQARYAAPPAPALADGEVAASPLLGFGRADNQLNEAVLALLRGARRKVVLLTPYFNLPRPVRAAVGQALRRGCTVEIMVGDKTANDFYIPPGQPFRTIGLLPYLYENNLRRYARAHRGHLASGQLAIRLWRDGDNSYHLKGLFVDDEYALLTGHNLNPRAWALDLENALLLRDPSRRLLAQHRAEREALRSHAVAVEDYRALESPRSYPPEVRRLLRRLSRVRLDRLVNRLL
ncbi:CDP-diacylglycerol--serine O-phosphatidyltransferase [Fulvimonas sp. R45]|uniref:CDP-diacylglycerol--serine O-phosphatidyltransferase n=1 Tax=Fulvimonas sp. R45 TaxID=3045937 RepID=UPI00265E6C78|nr:CDP-diacylglycerol--serine O-phosphatidyltransferase [Fulvimonas sp. R45]MDO1528886.1 CDP-diacylglycerol--serine O-phosphatidyltransferase [Fulvimonas sp. R45]